MPSSDPEEQTLLDLRVIRPPVQKEMLCCQICGFTWASEDAETIRRSWALHEKTVRGPLCNICWGLWSITNQAHFRKLSLKDAVFRFLKGRAKQLHIRDFRKVWEGK